MPDKKLNICLIVVDSLRADNLSCYGYNKNTSPNIDAISRDGTRFKNAFSQANWTYPSFYSLISGKYPSSHQIGWFDQKISKKLITLPEVLAKHGYNTALFSSFRTLVNPDTFGGHFQETRLTDIETGASEPVKDWFRGKEKAFLMFHIGDYVHEPYYAEKKYVDMFYKDGYDGLKFDDTLNCLVSKSMRDSGEKMRDVNRQLNMHIRRLDKKQLAYAIACYDAGIYYVDKFIGELYNIVKNESEDFLFIVTADHGQSFFEHGFYGHGLHLYDEVVKVPLIIATNQKKSSVFEEPVQHIDIYPTLLELLGIDGASIGLDGTSFVKEQSGRLSVSESYPYISIRNNRHKLITSHFKISENKNILKELHANSKNLRRLLFNYYILLSQDKLYNISGDSQEKNNVIKKEAGMHKLFTEKLKAVLKKSKQEVYVPDSLGMDDEIKRQLTNLGYM